MIKIHSISYINNENYYNYIFNEYFGNGYFNGSFNGNGYGFGDGYGFGFKSGNGDSLTLEILTKDYKND